MPENGQHKVEVCPRAIENGVGVVGSPFKYTGHCDWGSGPDRTCDYCGSLHPDDFMKRLEAGDELIPTDKSYKAYLNPGHRKFYFQHLDVEQRKKLVEMLNARTIKFAAPGHFYVRPFFVRGPVEPLDVHAE